MTLTIRTLNSKDSLIRTIRKLYIQSFPANERIPFPVILHMLKEEQNELLAFFDEDLFVGFVHLYHSNTMCFLYYLAVCEELRGRHYGTAILQRVLQRYATVPVVLEIDTPEESLKDIGTRKKRLSFYQRNGFRMTSVRYLFYGADYTLMVHGREISREEYEREAQVIYHRAARMYFIDPLPVSAQPE